MTGPRRIRVDFDVEEYFKRIETAREETIT
jgi:hypothetical protein